ncbi:MAG: hypothetical protein HC767_02515 [Akkermansiaceae bacterium]|nr:hypothetical protein [Akkermansiaceae bacterium]
MAAAIDAGELDLAGLETASPEFVHRHMTAISGIGPWTAEIFLLYARGERRRQWSEHELRTTRSRKRAPNEQNRQSDDCHRKDCRRDQRDVLSLA